MKKAILFLAAVCLNAAISCQAGHEDDKERMENTAGETGVTSNSTSSDTMNSGYSVAPRGNDSTDTSKRLK